MQCYYAEADPGEARERGAVVLSKLEDVVFTKYTCELRYSL